jgi:hypothetical protein
MNSGFYSILNITLSLFSLFNEDIKALFIPIQADKIFEIINQVIFFFFTFDLIFNTFFRKNFFGSFYFYLDFIAIIASLPEVKFIWAHITNLIKDEDINIVGEDILYDDFIEKAGKNTKMGSK